MSLEYETSDQEKLPALPSQESPLTKSLQQTVPKGSDGNNKSISNLTQIPSKVCRICQMNTVNEELISPCNCKGSLAYVHLSCLERWLNQASRKYCELCRFRYNATETQRYTLLEALRTWFQLPRNQGHVHYNILMSLVLSLLTMGLVCSCVIGVDYFVLEGQKLGIGPLWTRMCIWVCLCVVLFGFVLTMYLLVKEEILPFYRWWKRTVNVTLVLTPRLSEIHTQTHKL